MVFVDQATIVVKAGDGGRGCSSFAQPPYTRYPYPDGGDGGDGGNILLRADQNVATLLDFQFRHEFKAGRGGHGGSNKKSGKGGEDTVILLPPGTVIRFADSGQILRDLTEHGEEFLIAKGGRGGYGNSTVPEAQSGRPGQEYKILLELKLIADIGIIGRPNAGKSSLLARISTARPKVAAYPFTTRYPVLGVVQIDSDRAFVACDIPGLIEGAHEGKGLGMQFLRHIERTRLLVHMVDLAATDGMDPLEAFRQVNHELESYHAPLAAKAQIIVGNKIDIPGAREQIERFRKEMGVVIHPISCATGEGIPELLRILWDQVQQQPPVQPADAETDGAQP